MAKKMEKLAEEIHELSDIEKLWLVDMILKDLDKPDRAIDRVWAAEARKRWQPTSPVESQRFLKSVMAKHLPLVRVGFVIPT